MWWVPHLEVGVGAAPRRLEQPGTCGVRVPGSCVRVRSWFPLRSQRALKPINHTTVLKVQQHLKYISTKEQGFCPEKLRYFAAAIAAATSRHLANPYSLTDQARRRDAVCTITQSAVVRHGSNPGQHAHRVRLLPPLCPSTCLSPLE